MATDIDSLLPTNATPLERELARLSVRLDGIDVSVIATIWDAWRCPAAILPWLAWELSVDYWDEAWPETVKRQTIAASPDYHRKKGTRFAVERTLALAELPYEITEWFETTPPSRRGTASIHVDAPMDRIASVLRSIRPLVMTSKPKSRAVFFGAGEKATGVIPLGGGIHAETQTVIEPYQFTADEPQGAFAAVFGMATEELTVIEGTKG